MHFPNKIEKWSQSTLTIILVKEWISTIYVYTVHKDYQTAILLFLPRRQSMSSKILSGSWKNASYSFRMPPEDSQIKLDWIIVLSWISSIHSIFILIKTLKIKEERKKEATEKLIIKSIRKITKHFQNQKDYESRKKDKN